jgi:hypothetical protein
MIFLPEKPLNGQLPSRWREFSFALHQIQAAIEPHIGLRQTLASWNEIGRALAEPPRSRLQQKLKPSDCFPLRQIGLCRITDPPRIGFFSHSMEPTAAVNQTKVPSPRLKPEG